MRLIDLSLGQLSTNSLLSRLQYDSSPCPCSSSLFLSPGFLLLLSSFFFYPSVSFLLKVFQAYIGRQRKSNTKNVQSKKNKKEPIQHKKEGNTLQRQWNATQKRERTCLLPHSHRKRFLREGFSLSCPRCNLISVSERCAIRCYFEQGH